MWWIRRDANGMGWDVLGHLRRQTGRSALALPCLALPCRPWFNGRGCIGSWGFSGSGSDSWWFSQRDGNGPGRPEANEAQQRRKNEQESTTPASKHPGPRPLGPRLETFHRDSTTDPEPISFAISFLASTCSSDRSQSPLPHRCPPAPALSQVDRSHRLRSSVICTLMYHKTS